MPEDKTNEPNKPVDVPPPEVAQAIADKKTPREEIIRRRRRKEWWDYFFDFFMLFLAVTLGFFVENKREQMSDRDKEKQYMRSYVEDLKDDSSNLNMEIYRNTFLINGVDSLITAIYQYTPGDYEATRKMYDYYVRYARNTYLVNFTDRTMSQLKNSGNLRLIKRLEVSDSIMRYNDWINYVKSQENLYRESWSKALDFSCSIFDYKYLRYNTSNTNLYQYYPQTYYQLLDDQLSSLSKYANLLELWKQVVYGYIYNLQSQKLKATTLIPYLKEQYSLE